MRRLAKILFHIGNTVLLLLGLAHLAAHFSGAPSPVNDNQRKFLELFSATPFEMPSGEMRTYEEIMAAFSLYFAVFPMGMAVLLWISARRPETFKPSLTVAVAVMLLTAFITYKYAILPPLVMMLIVAVCFAGAFFLLGEKK